MYVEKNNCPSEWGDTLILGYCYVGDTRVTAEQSAAGVVMWHAYFCSAQHNKAVCISRASLWMERNKSHFTASEEQGEAVSLLAEGLLSLALGSAVSNL